MNNFTYSNELYHHGILGQKWGIRRYQNEDGTLTPEGLERYGGSKKLIYDTRPTSHKTRLLDAGDAKKSAQVKASQKDAADTIKYYGGKRVAERKIRDEFDYVAKKNAAKFAVGEALAAGTAAAGLFLAEEGAELIGVGLLGAAGVAAPVLAIGAAAANAVLAKNRDEKIDYILDSPVGNQNVTDEKRQRLG